MTVFQSHVDSLRSGTSPSATADELYASLTPREKLWLLDGDIGFRTFFTRFFRDGYCYQPVEAGAIPRLGIPGIRFSDGPRGIQLGGKGTAFPASNTRAQTWDPAPEEQVVSLHLFSPLAYLTNSSTGPRDG
jgi:beta-glucosidase